MLEEVVVRYGRLPEWLYARPWFGCACLDLTRKNTRELFSVQDLPCITTSRFINDRSHQAPTAARTAAPNNTHRLPMPFFVGVWALACFSGGYSGDQTARRKHSSSGQDTANFPKFSSFVNHEARKGEQGAVEGARSPLGPSTTPTTIGRKDTTQPMPTLVSTAMRTSCAAFCVVGAKLSAGIVGISHDSYRL